jgi:hypothetical protein
MRIFIALLSIILILKDEGIKTNTAQKKVVDGFFVSSYSRKINGDYGLKIICFIPNIPETKMSIDEILYNYNKFIDSYYSIFLFRSDEIAIFHNDSIDFKKGYVLRNEPFLTNLNCPIYNYNGKLIRSVKVQIQFDVKKYSYTDIFKLFIDNDQRIKFCDSSYVYCFDSVLCIEPIDFRKLKRGEKAFYSKFK